ncbi:CPCC family cysteine-rich protein [Chitinimonas prasina]|nr:CPCC family cysteine-rich protein [Chitinimonas prasina]
MTREEAIALLVARDVSLLSPTQRENVLCDWWAIDAADPDYARLPDALKEMLGCIDGPADPSLPLYAPLLCIAFRHTYLGVLNSYLEDQLATLGHDEIVEGAVEVLESCPCCGYRSLHERGAYEICKVCFWEDDGSVDNGCVSGPNHMGLREARLSFLDVGAVTESEQQYILSDGKARYAYAGF